MYCITSHRWMHGCAISVVPSGTVRVYGIVVWHAAMWIPVMPVSPTPECTILVVIDINMIIISAWFALVAGVRGGAMCVCASIPTVDATGAPNAMITTCANHVSSNKRDDLWLTITFPHCRHLPTIADRLSRPHPWKTPLPVPCD